MLLDAHLPLRTFTVVQRYKSVNYIDVNGLPTYILETYGPSTLTVFDYHGKQATCSATVAVYVRTIKLNYIFLLKRMLHDDIII